MKKKLLVLMAGVSALALASCGGDKDNETSTTQPNTPVETTKPAETQKEVAHTFTGKTTIDEVAYDVVLSAYKDGTFLLNPGKGVKTFDGTYEYIEGTGYKFNINDANKTIVETTWNETLKQHEATFTLKLGDAGTGKVLLTLADPDFVLTVKDPREAFLEDRAKFTGVLEFNGRYVFTTNFHMDGTFELVPDAMQNFLTKKGTYTYENNTFTLTVAGKEYKSVFDIATGIYTIDFEFKGNEATLPLKLTFDSKKPSDVKGRNDEKLGGTQVVLNMAADGTCVFDVTCNVEAFPGIQEAFDFKGTWSHLGPNYKFLVEQTNPKTETTETKEYEGVYDVATNTIKVNYDITGPEGTIDYVLEGQFPQMQRMHCYEDSEFGMLSYDLIFQEDGKAWMKVTTPHPDRNKGNYDDHGTYTFENNVLTFNKAAEAHEEEPSIAEEAETYTSTWDEETGTYSFTYNLHLKRISKVFHPVITYTVF